jgi:cyclomaltodextrinase
MRIATLLQMTLPGAPCVYYGDELGLEGEQDPYCRGSFPWDRDRWEHGLRAYVRDLIGIRRRHRALRDGELRVLAAEGDVFAMLRQADGESFVVATNAGEEQAQLTVTLPEGYGRTEGASIVTLGGMAGGSVAGAEGSLDLVLPERTGIVVRLAAQDVLPGSQTG